MQWHIIIYMTYVVHYSLKKTALTSEVSYRWPIQTKDVVVHSEINLIVVQSTTQYVGSEVNKCRPEVSTFRSDVSTFRSEVSTSRSGVNTYRSEVSTLRSDINTLRSKVNTYWKEQWPAMIYRFLVFKVCNIMHSWYYKNKSMSVCLQVN